MFSPRVEVLSALPGLFRLERVALRQPDLVKSVRLERKNDDRGFPVRWNLRINGREFLDSAVPITFNGEDPFEMPSLAHRVPPFATYPGFICVIDLEDQFWAFL